MTKKRLAVAALVGLLTAGSVALASGARVKEPLGEYAARRARLLASLDGPVVLFGYSSEKVTLLDTLRQEENFYYLTGHEEEGAALLLVPQTPAAKAAGLPAEVLFLPPRDLKRERWDGVRVGPEDPAASRKLSGSWLKPASKTKRVCPRRIRLGRKKRNSKIEKPEESKRNHRCTRMNTDRSDDSEQVRGAE